MSGVWLPGSAFTISLLLLIIFFSKKNMESTEVKVYSYILIINFFFSFNAVVGYIASKTIGIRNLIALIQKVHLSLLVVIAALLFYYMLAINISLKQKYKRMIKISNVVCILLVLAVFICPVEVINHGEILDVGGLSYQVAMSGIILYFLGIIILNLYYFKTNHNYKKNIPFVVLTLLFLLAFILRIYYPEVITETYCVAFALLVMYFTIENPDIKMLQQMELSKNEAEKANRAKTDFLSSMSHEIRTPLNAIVGFSECIKESNNIEEAHQDADDVIKASQTLLEIVNGILDISKIESGKLEITNSDYQSKELFLDVAKLITPKMEEKALDFQISIAQDIPDTLYGDYGNVKKVITNILSNAAKYTEKGYVKYDVRCINSKSICRLIISVEDSGRGIKSENLDKLFTKFERLDEDKNTTLEGTGLGLAITKQLVELMGGKVVVQSVYGKGSRFTIILDQRIEKEKIKEEPQSISTQQNLKTDLSNKRVLIVDDNTLNIKVATKLLEKLNLDIDSCESGFEAIDKIKNGESYDLILLDDMMPKLSGVDTFKRLREIYKVSTPIVALTANAISGMKEKYLSEGFDDYLAKPIDKEELNRILYQYLTQENRDSIKSIFGELPKEVYEVGKGKGLMIPDSENAMSSIDFSYLKDQGVDVEKSLELLGEESLYIDTMKEFLDHYEERLNKLKEYKKDKKLKDYCIEVHALKSDAKYLGFTNLSELAYQQEIKSKEGNSHYIDKYFFKLEEELGKVVEISNHFMDSQTT